MSHEAICLKCGIPLADEGRGGFCPKCLFREAVAIEGSRAGLVDSSVEPGAFNHPLPRQFGDYELLEEIARGGMGIIYRARQGSLNRIVAVKMLLFGPLSSPEFIKRFRAEAAAAASLSHPNIVAIHEVGVHHGQQYFAMDFVEGPSLAKLLAHGSLPTRTAAIYLRTVAEAIHYAHDCGILHRDLKPSNVLIDPTDQPRVTDFGLARRLESDSEITATGQVLGSPSYMPPEQASGKGAKLSRRSDVYSLGAMLYHLLTGRPPFVGEALTDVLEQVLNSEPISPGLLNPSLPQDVETICLKCLEKEPQQRYPTARALADELDRFLKDEPIHARPVSRAERVWRWCRRKPALASLVAATSLLLLAVLIGGPVAINRVALERAQAEANLIRQYVATGNRLGEQGSFADALPWFAEALRLEPDPERVAMNRLRLAICIAECPVPQRVWFLNGQVLTADFSLDDSKLALGTSDGTVTIWNLHDGHRVAPELNHGQCLESVKFSPDGRRMLTTAKAGTEALSNSQTKPESRARLWDTTTGAMLFELPHASRVRAACFSEDGRRVATASRQDGVKVWRADDGAELLAVPETTNTLDVVWNRCSETLFVCQADGSISAREPEHGRTLWSGRHNGAAHIAVHTAGEHLLSFGDASTIEVRNATDGARLHQLSAGGRFGTGGFNYAAFSPDGKYLLGSCRNASAIIWAMEDGRRVTTIREAQHFTAGVFDLVARFDRRGERIITQSNAGARIWDAATGLGLSPPVTAFTRVQVAKFSAGGDYFVTAGADSVCRLWRTASKAQNRTVFPWRRPVDACAFSPDGQRIALAGGGAAGLWSAAGNRLSTNLLHEKRGTPNDFVEFSRDGRKLVSTGSGEAMVWDVDSGKPLYPPLRHSTDGDLIARFAPNGRQVVTFGVDGIARFWHAETGREEILLYPVRNSGASNAPAPVFSFSGGLQFSPDGTLLLTAGGGPVAQLWKLTSGEPIGSSMVHSARIQSAAFSPNGRFVATGDHDGLARIWDVPSGAEACRPLKHFGYVSKAMFSRDGARLLTASADRLATIWDVGSGRALVRLLHDDYVNDAVFSPDERLIATASEKGLRLWDARSGEAASPYIAMNPQKAQAWRVMFSPDGRQVLACSQYAQNATLFQLGLDMRTESEWLDLAAVVSSQHVLSDGRLESLTSTELAAAWDRAKAHATGKSSAQ